MALTLSNDEQALLVSILQDTLGEVREQVYKSEIGEYHDDLKQKEAMIRDILGRLGAPAPAPTPERPV